MIIGVKDDGKGNPAICRYWYADSMSPARRRNPLPYQLLLNASYRDKLAVLETDVNLTDVLTYAVKLFPGLETYTAEDWWSEWGCKYDPHTNTARFAA
ncbi:MAG: hypothetical protein LIP12_01745 [Clostridiales bacterium]|nr:hypothetical protein [Clostridiales bacterium]